MDKVTTKEKRRMHYGFVILICCCLMMGINVGLVFSCAGIFYKPVSQSLGVEISTFAFYMPIMYVASTLMLTIAGKMIERRSARYLLAGSSVLMGLTLIAMGFFTQVWEFYIAGGVLGVTLAFLLYLSFPTLINRWFRTNVGLLMGICSAASGLGGVIFNPIGGAIIESYGWSWGYITFGLIVLLIVSPVLFILLRDYPADKNLDPYGEGKEEKTVKAKKPAREAISYSKAVRMPIFYGVFIFAFLMMACSTLNLYIPAYTQSLKYTVMQASIVAAAVMVGVAAGKILLGFINDRNCTLGVLVTTLGGLIGFVCLISGNTGFWLLLFGAVLFGLQYAGVTVQTAMLTRTVFGSLDYARIYSIISMALAAGGAVASGAWGLIVDACHSYIIIYLIGIGMMVICSLIGLRALKS